MHTHFSYEGGWQLSLSFFRLTKISCNCSQGCHPERKRRISLGNRAADGDPSSQKTLLRMTARGKNNSRYICLFFASVVKDQYNNPMVKKDEQLNYIR